MNLKRAAKRLTPAPVWNIGRDGYTSIRRNWLATVVGCQTTEKVVALTFDDGPEPNYTPQVLNLLHQHGAKATFFVLGRNADAHAEVMRAIASGGHEIGNHTYSHARLSDLSTLEILRELRQCDAAVARACGVKPVLMRPPQAAQTPLSFAIARAQGYRTVHWSASGEDWLGHSADWVAQRVLKEVRPGAIILLHDACEPLYPGQHDYDRIRDRKATLEALSLLFEELRGYRFVTVSQMLRAYPTTKKIWFKRTKK